MCSDGVVSQCVCLHTVSRMVRSVSPTDLAQKAFVRGLSDEADEDTLRRTFAKFGEVVEGENLCCFISDNDV